MSILLLILPLTIGTLWHCYIIWLGWRRGRLKNSFSENSLQTNTALAIHRFIHIALTVCFIIFSYGLWQQGQKVLALMLTLAVLLDTAQVVTLTRKTNHVPMYFRDIHQVTA